MRVKIVSPIQKSYSWLGIGLTLSLFTALSCSHLNTKSRKPAESNSELDAFFGAEHIYYVRVTNWDSNIKHKQPQEIANSMYKAQKKSGAKVEIFHTAQDSNNGCPDTPSPGNPIFGPSQDFEMGTKGNMTKGLPKSSYKIKLAKDEKFLGHRELVLNSMVNDPSQMHEAVIWPIVRKLELPGSRQTYVKFCIDGRFMGLYSMIEPIDKTYLKEHFSNKGGNLYKMNWVTDPPGSDHSGWGAASLSYREGPARNYAMANKKGDQAYALEKGDDEENTDSNSYNDLATFIKTLNGKNLSSENQQLKDPFNTLEYEQQMLAIFNVEAFLKFAALNNLLGAWDNYWATYGNYLLYNVGQNGNTANKMTQPYFHWVPWDYDNTFGNTFKDKDDGHITKWAKQDIIGWNDYGGKNKSNLPLLDNLMRNAKFRKLYLNSMEYILDNYFKEDYISAKTSEIWKLIKRTCETEGEPPNNTGRPYNNKQIEENAFLSNEVDVGTAGLHSYGIVNFVKWRHDIAKDRIEYWRSRPVQ